MCSVSVPRRRVTTRAPRRYRLLTVRETVISLPGSAVAAGAGGCVSAGGVAERSGAVHALKLGEPLGDRRVAIAGRGNELEVAVVPHAAGAGADRQGHRGRHAVVDID